MFIRTKISRTGRTTECGHRERHYARGLCRACWFKWRRRNLRKNHPKKFRAFLAKGRLWNKRYRDAHPEKEKERSNKSYLKCTFGLTVKKANSLRKERPCAICKVRDRRMVIDHAPGTKGKYRGVLCNPCNVRLGWLERRLERILKYIGK